MKVEIVNTAKDRGGAAKMAATLVGAFRRYHPGVQVRMTHFGDHESSDSFVGLGKLWQTYAMALQTRVLGSGNIYDFGVSRQISQALADADVVHLHNLHGYYVNYRSLVGMIRDKPIVWTWHDMWGVTGRCGFASGCQRWAENCAPCPRKHQYPAAWIDHSEEEYVEKFRTFTSLDRLLIVCPSDWLAEIAVQRGYPADRVRVVPNPVDTETFTLKCRTDARQKLGLDSQRPLAMFIAESCDEARKGYGDFCTATLKNDCDAMAIGSPPKEPAEHVKHFGRINNKERLADLYAAADVMIIPSYADNYPNTVVESLIAGTPVIGYEEGGIPSQLSDPWSAVTPRGDADELARTLRRFLGRLEESRANREELARLSRQRWSPDLISAEYLKLYNELVDAAA
jgi:glycosyltransferase involved in cell wall biosynthesis